MTEGSEVEYGFSSAKVAILVARMTDDSEVECRLSAFELRLLDFVDTMMEGSDTEVEDSDTEVEDSGKEVGKSVELASTTVHGPSVTGWRFLMGLFPLRLLGASPFLLLGLLPFLLLFLFPLRLLGLLPTGLKVVSSGEVLSVVKIVAGLDSTICVEVMAGSVEEVGDSSSKFSNSKDGTLLPPDSRKTS